MQRRKTFADRTPQENALVAAVRSLRDVFFVLFFFLTVFIELKTSFIILLKNKH